MLILRSLQGLKFFITTLVVIGTFYLAGVSAAEAGLFSFISDLLTAEKEIKIEKIPNVQTAMLLQSTLSSNPSSGSGGGGITIVNQSALLADTGPMGSMADIEESTVNSDHISIYVVREGDSLSQIAKMFGVSVNTIIWSNDIDKGDLIKTGQTLVILPITGIRYTIQKGDTVASIAKKFNGDVDEILRYNDLSVDGALAVGNVVVIPDGELPHTQTSSSSYTTPARGTGGPNYVGYYLRPIEGGIKTQGLHGYNGVDLAAYCGAPIFAAASGDVIISRSYGWNGGYGNYIVIAHDNGTQTLYAHNSQNIVTAGWNVVRGQVIGYIGTTGKSTGCHVHFEVRGAKNPF
ncbi:MAG: M23 family metallopeptidase [bacterium]